MASRSALRPPFAVGRRWGRCARPAVPSGTAEPLASILTRPPPSGDGADVAGEILDFISNGGPVQRALMRVGQRWRAIHDLRRAELERAFHRDRLPRTVSEHPGDRVGQPTRVTAVARAPPRIRHPAGRPYRVWRAAFRSYRRVEEVLASLYGCRVRICSRKIGRLNARERFV